MGAQEFYQFVTYFGLAYMLGAMALVVFLEWYDKHR